MTELAARLSRPRGPILQALVAAAGVALVVAGLLALRPQPSHDGSPRSRPAVDTTGVMRGAPAHRAFARAAAAAVARAQVSSTLSEAAARSTVTVEALTLFDSEQ